MKQTFLIILTIGTIVSFSACNGNEGKTESKTEVDSLRITQDTGSANILSDTCTGLANFLISEKEADTMKKKYAELYIKSSASGKYLSDSVWIDAKVIAAFASLFESNPQMDGVRFINATKNAGKKCMVILVPTIPRAATQDDESTHVNDWTTIQVPGTPEFQHYSLGKKITKERQDMFKKLYSKGKHLSASVWLSKCIITSLSRFISNESYNVDGIRVWFGAYLDYRYQRRNPSQVYEDQSTIIVVPTHPDGNRHVDDWTILREKLIFKKSNNGYNHGELCPQKCDTIP